MGIQLNGTSGTDVISAVDGSLTVEGLTISGDFNIADKIIHSGDTNTAIRFPAADTFAVETGGDERLRIKSDGEIGINTTGYAGGGDDPQLYVFGVGGGRQVKIHNPTAGTSSIQLSNATTGQGNDNGFQLAQLAGGDFYFEHQLQAKDIVFRTKPSGGSINERLRITSDGKFGFNDDDPERTIDVKGSNCMIQLEGTGGSGRQYSLCSTDDVTGAAVGSAGQFVIYDDTSGTARLNITSSGIVGINKTDPDGKGIDVSHGRTNGYSGTTDTRGLAHIIARNTSDAPGRFASISLVQGGSTQAEASINLVQTGNYTGDLTFKTRYGATSWAERLRIASNGRVGIGTGVPASRLNLKLSARGTADFRITDSDTTSDVLRSGSQADGDGYLQLRTIAGAGNVLLDASGVSYINGGNFGINAANPNAKFQVEGASAYAVTSSGRAVEGIDVNATAGGTGNYGSGISFGAGATGRAAIVSVQEASDADNVGLAVITHPTGLSSADGVQKIHIKSGGDVEITDGNLLLASGHGVNFQASGTGSGTTVNSHVLDDYERGTFTPKIYYGTGTSEPSYSWRYGNYVKVGKQVTIWFNIGITGFNPSNTEQVYIANLPFQYDDPNSGQWKYLNLMYGYSWASGWGFNNGSDKLMYLSIYDNESKVRIVKGDGAHIWTSDVGSGQRWSSSFSYHTDS